MKTNFTLSNILGTVYRGGKIIFSSSGDRLISPIGNRVVVFDLKSNHSATLPGENKSNIRCLAVSPDDSLLLCIDDEGRCVVHSLQTRVPIHYFNFKGPVRDAKFSPCGKMIAATHHRMVQVWRSPAMKKEFSPFILLKTFSGPYDETVFIDWSDDSRFLLTGSKDMTIRVNSVQDMEGFRQVIMSGHKSSVVACFFEPKTSNIYSVSRDGTLLVWSLAEVETQKSDQASPNVVPDVHSVKEVFGSPLTNAVTLSSQEKSQRPHHRWTQHTRYYFDMEAATVTCCQYHKLSRIMIVGFSHGTFGLYELPEFNKIQTISFSKHKVTASALNATGDWCAFASASLGQLLVWEWRSESYILKQQGHFLDMGAVTYSPDGQYLATGGDDAKVKLWNTHTCCCFVTFTEHTAGITGLCFTQNGLVVVSSSLDGTVRAFDLNRYRNFRTFVSPQPVQFSCVSVDPSSDLVAAGSLDVYDVYVWSMPTGRLLEVLSGHQAPVSSLSFLPNKAVLMSGSWDKEVRVWDVLQNASLDTFRTSAEVTALACRHDGIEVAVATTDGSISFWQYEDNILNGSIEGRKDLGRSRMPHDKITAAQSLNFKHFTALCYSPDGTTLLAGGRSKYVCLYEVRQKVLLKKFEISRNSSMGGTTDILSSRNMTEAGPREAFNSNTSDGSQDEDDGDVIKMPGTQRADLSSRRVKPEILVKRVQFSPTGRSWAAATTEGLLVFSLDGGLFFDPFDVDEDITVESVRKCIRSHGTAKAVTMAIKLNEPSVLLEAVESTNVDEIPLIVDGLPPSHVERLLAFVADQLDVSRHVEFYLHWSLSLLRSHGVWIKDNSLRVGATLRTLQKSMTRFMDDFGKMSSANTYSLEYLISVASLSKQDPLATGPTAHDDICLDIMSG